MSEDARETDPSKTTPIDPDGSGTRAIGAPPDGPASVEETQAALKPALLKAAGAAMDMAGDAAGALGDMVGAPSAMGAMGKMF